MQDSLDRKIKNLELGDVLRSYLQTAKAAIEDGHHSVAVAHLSLRAAATVVWECTGDKTDAEKIATYMDLVVRAANAEFGKAAVDFDLDQWIRSQSPREGKCGEDDALKPI